MVGLRKEWFKTMNQKTRNEFEKLQTAISVSLNKLNLQECKELLDELESEIDARSDAMQNDLESKD